MLSLRSLASGSNGNAYLLQAGDTRILVDCGLSGRRIVNYLWAFGVDPSTLSAILLTHEHSDHVQSLGTLARRYRLPVIANEATLRAAERAVGHFEGQPLATGATMKHDGLTVTSFAVSHDAAEPVGYFLAAAGAAICLATDLGTATPEVHGRLAQADLLVLEANHDRERLIHGPYPMPLKARILSDSGHLSNLQSAEMIAQAARDRVCTVWLAHLSEVNNTPRLALKVISNYLDMAEVCGPQLEVALRNRPSVSWRAGDVVRQIPLI